MPDSQPIIIEEQRAHRADCARRTAHDVRGQRPFRRVRRGARVSPSPTPLRTGRASRSWNGTSRAGSPSPTRTPCTPRPRPRASAPTARASSSRSSDAIPTSTRIPEAAPDRLRAGDRRTRRSSTACTGRLLHDPNQARPLAVEKPVVRKNAQPIAYRADDAARALPARAPGHRPAGGVRDVSYRTISRPLVEALETARVPAQVDIVRPGTFEALVTHLEDVRDEHGDGYYHVIHLDMHGALLTHEQYESALASARAQPPPPSEAAITPEATSSPTTACRPSSSSTTTTGTAAKAARRPGQRRGSGRPAQHAPDPHRRAQRLPVRQAGGRQRDQPGQPPARRRRADGGGHGLLGDRHRGQTLMTDALHASSWPGRHAGHRHAPRPAGALQRQEAARRLRPEIELEDWLLPVVYQNRPRRTFDRERIPGPRAAGAPRTRPPRTDVRLRGPRPGHPAARAPPAARSNVLLVRGMGGAGKTTLLHHLAWWWQKTGFVDAGLLLRLRRARLPPAANRAATSAAQLGLPLTGISADDRAAVLQRAASARATC